MDAMLARHLARLKEWARALKRETHALYLASKDPRTPLIAKIVVMVVVAYALSPIDLIPDFIPVLGYLDDLILVPLGIALAVRLIPPDVLEESRRLAAEFDAKPRSLVGALLIISLWIGGLVFISYLMV